MLDRLELVCAQIAELERERDAVLEEEAPDKAEEMIQRLAGLQGIGVQSATVLGGRHHSIRRRLSRQAEPWSSPVPNAGPWLGHRPAGCEVCREVPCCDESSALEDN